MAHLVPDAVAQDAGIVHHRVDAAEVLHRILEDARRALGVRDSGAVRQRLAAGGLDVVHDFLRGGEVGAFALGAAAQIVDDDRCAFLGAQQRDLAPDAAPRLCERGHSRAGIHPIPFPQGVFAGEYPMSNPMSPGAMPSARLAEAGLQCPAPADFLARSEEHTSELQSLMRISYAVFCLETKKKQTQANITPSHSHTDI